MRAFYPGRLAIPARRGAQRPGPPEIGPGYGEDADQARLQAELTALVARCRRSLGTDRRYLLEQFELADAARKVVGVGSVGSRCWIVLVLGRDRSDPLFLQVKEAGRPFSRTSEFAAAYANQNERDDDRLAAAAGKTGRVLAERDT